MKCSVCDQADFIPFYNGKIRKGKYPNFIDDGRIYRCPVCETQMYDGPEINYETEEYRELVDSSSSSSAYYQLHDAEQPSRLSFINTADFRGATFIDVGAGAGSFLDLVKGFAGKTVAVEPAAYYHAELAAKSSVVFAYMKDALHELRGKADIVTCFSVIEHIDNPLLFMQALVALCRPGGTILVSTPNSDDWLIEFLPLTYKSFFYRVVHKWYLNSTSLNMLGKRTELSEIVIKFRQRFPIGNALNWIRSGMPTGNANSFFSNMFERVYREELESKGKSDYIYLIAKK